jgi:phenylalanyl-tRNA synthetase beta subunit
LKWAALLVKELAGGEICGEVVDIYPNPVAPFPVTLTYEKIDTLIGKHIPVDTVKSILNSLEIKIVSETEKELSLQVPTYRVDVQRDVDVIEDLLRIYGYNHVEISDRVHSSLSYKTVTDQSHQFQNLVSEQLTGCGFNEIMNNSLSCGAYYDDLQVWPRAHCVALLNPLSNDLNVMRQTLLFGGLESISHNINRRRANLRFYEEATKLATKNADKADYQYRVAQLYSNLDNYGRAREAARNSIEFNPNSGKPYILIGKLYASSTVFDDPVLRKTVFWVAVDKFVKAKQVDSSCADEANELIRRYSPHFPSKDDMFFKPELNEGKSFFVGGWIGESTTCR